MVQGGGLDSGRGPDSEQLEPGGGGVLPWGQEAGDHRARSGDGEHLDNTGDLSHTRAGKLCCVLLSSL